MVDTSSSPVKRNFDADIRKVKSTLKRAKDAYLSEIDTLEEYKENKLRLENEIKSLEAKKEKTAFLQNLI